MGWDIELSGGGEGGTQLLFLRRQAHVCALCLVHRAALMSILYAYERKESISHIDPAALVSVVSLKCVLRVVVSLPIAVGQYSESGTQD